MKWRNLAAFATACALAAPPAGAAATTVDTGSCGWPLRTDPTVVNVAWPDEYAVYWITALPVLPPGLAYQIRADFPLARYISYTAYNGLPIHSIYDEEIVPTSGVNPFIAGNGRLGRDREYVVPLIAAPAPAEPGDRVAGALYIGAGQLGTPSPAPYLIYRLYVPDTGTDLTGQGGVPRIEIVADAGGETVTLAADECETLRNAAAEPFGPVHEAVKETAFPVRPPVPLMHSPSQPTTNPPTWVAQSGLPAATAARLGMPGLVSGGPFNNDQNSYVVAALSRAYGEVTVIRIKAPTFARSNGESVMGSGELRYWSFCETSRSTRYVACLMDEQIVLDPGGFATVVMTVEEDLPDNAVNWIPYGPETEGYLFYRQQIPSEEFYPHSAFAAEDGQGDPAEVMGEYFPEVIYCSTEEFEADRCGIDD